MKARKERNLGRKERTWKMGQENVGVEGSGEGEARRAERKERAWKMENNVGTKGRDWKRKGRTLGRVEGSGSGRMHEEVEGRAKRLKIG